MSDLYPLWMLKYLPNMTACHLAIANDARGPNNTISLGDASALLALIEAVQVIQRDLADVMVCGGSGCRLNLTPWMYRGALNQSQRNDAPQKASRPFDADRDGVVNGEGAAAFILESRPYAEARGANILARVFGWGSTFAPQVESEASRSDAIQRSIGLALERSGFGPREIGHINAHGLSTVPHDRSEAKAIRQALDETPVTAMKSLFGSLGAAGGAVELVGSVLALIHDEVPATINYEKPDPECPVNVVHGAPQKGLANTALLLNQSTTGQCAAVVLAGE
jgi:3-oxoacyl-[acyl-carrier-protein] synthase II